MHNDEHIDKLLELVGPQNRQEAAGLIDLLLEEQTAQLAQTNHSLNEIRLATLNMMEDAVLAKDRLSESEAKWRSYVKDAPYGIFIADRSGKYLEVNPAAAGLSGYSEEELLSRSIPDLLAPANLTAGLAHFQKVIDTGHATGDLLCRLGNGELRWWQVSAVRLSDDRFLGFAEDITETKKNKTALEESRRFLRTIIDSIPSGVFWKDSNSVYLGCNEAFATDAGAETPDELVGKTDFDLGWPIEDAESYRQDDLEVIELGTAKLGFEESLSALGSAPRWAKTNKVPLKDKNGNVIGVLGTYEDITERKRMEEALEKRVLALTRPLEDNSDITFEDLFDLQEIQRIQDEFSAATGVASIITDADGTPITEPSNFTHLCRDIIRKTELGCANCYKSDAIVGRHHPDGPVVQQCMSSGLWDAGANITVGGRHIANWMIGQVRDIVQTDDVMRAYARKIGADEEEFMNAFHQVPVMSLDQFEAVAQSLFSLATQLSASAYQNMQQARFISEQQEAAVELRRLSTAIEQSPEAIVITDTEGTIQYVNPAFEQITGYSRTEALGQNPSVLQSGEHDEAFYADLWQAITSGREWQGQIINKRKDGSQYTEEATITPVRDARGVIINYVAVKRDITEELIREAELRQAQKMDAIGQLAGGIAHDFNNILQGVLGFSEMLKISLAEDSPEFDSASEIHKAAQRAAQLTQQLLAFSRKQPVQYERLDLNATIHDAESFLYMLLGKQYVLELELKKGLPEVNADHGQLMQIIMNLAVNARDAMPEGGRLSIATDHMVMEERDVLLPAGAAPGAYVCLSVTDTGCGMEPGVKERLFDPFFTTKGVGEGTGLGLSVVYGIVEQSNGWVNVYSEPDLGSCFKVFLPAYDLFAGPHPENEAGPGGAILLIEDDQEVRDMEVEMLASVGHRVVSAGSAEEGLKLFTEHDGRFDLLVSDMILPGMRGDELADALRKIKPALPVLLLSGYQDEKERWSHLSERSYFFLSKPFTVTSLLDTVRTLLNHLLQPKDS